MKTFILIATLIASLGWASAHAQNRQCTTQCFRNFNGSQTCFTNCN